MADASTLKTRVTDSRPSRSVLVTGTSTGIGRAIALTLDGRGYRVFAGVRRLEDGELLRAAASERLRPLILDVTDAASVAAARGELEAALGSRGLDGLVNNAGIAVVGPLECVPLDSVRRQFEVNVLGALAMVQAFGAMLRNARGRVVNVGSIGGFIAPRMQGPYCASKFALEGLTDSLRRELASFGVHVSLIQPGSIDTPIWTKGQAERRQSIETAPEHARELYREMSLRALTSAQRTAARGISPEAVAKVAVHALEARRPRTRYLVGPDAYAVRFLTWGLPDRSVDWLLDKLL